MTVWRVVGVSAPEGDPVESWIGADGTLVDAPPEGDIEDLPGRFVTAGLVDAHVHLALDASKTGMQQGSEELIASNLADHVAAGVLLARDVGAPIGARVGGEHSHGPKVLSAGRFFAPPGRYFPGLYEEVDPEIVVETAVSELGLAGGGWIKLIADFPNLDAPNRFEPIVNYAMPVIRDVVDAVHAAGGRVAAHTTGAFVSDLIAAGVDSIEHGLSLSEEDVDALASRGGAWTPTLSAMTVGLRRDAAADGEMAKRSQERLDALRELIPRAAKTGVTVLAGTDTTPHGSLAAEVALLAEFGLEPHEALAAATTRARSYLGADRFTFGAPADLVTYESDPCSDIDVLSSPAAIVRGGLRIR